MGIGDDVTVAEVYRLLGAMNLKLDSIDTQVRITNGRTTKLETEMIDVKEDVRDIKELAANPPSVPIVNQEGESLSIKVSPKMWALIAAAFGSLTVFGPVILEWVKSLLGQK
jgi:hypothetical protein